MTQILLEFDFYSTKKCAMNFVELEDISFDGKFDNTKKSKGFERLTNQAQSAQIKNW